MTYKVRYKVKNRLGEVIKQGTMKVKNADNSAIAQIKLEKFLIKKIPGFHSLVVIGQPIEVDDDVLDLFRNIFGM